VAGGIEAMLDGVHPMDDDHLAPLLAETAVMDRLLDDLRTLSLAEAGALPLHREPVDLRSLADEVVAAHRPRATAGVVTLGVTGSGPVITSVDPVRVREILGNLVGNALRHTPSGGTVTIEVGTDGGEALLVVRDTGEGIAAADLPRVFDRFHRRADSGGSGLGLAIVRDLAAAHGGSVTVESDGVPGRGATFRVRLPLRD
jgi:two-component system sensor histidine kinase BaeS